MPSRSVHSPEARTAAARRRVISVRYRRDRPPADRARARRFDVRRRRGLDTSRRRRRRKGQRQRRLRGYRARASTRVAATPRRENATDGASWAWACVYYRIRGRCGRCVVAVCGESRRVEVSCILFQNFPSSTGWTRTTREARCEARCVRLGRSPRWWNRARTTADARRRRRETRDG
jgi:hypothetical protein